MFFFLFFLKNFLSGPRSILWSHWLLLFWTSCVLPHGFQIQSGYLACTLSCLHAVILKVMSGVTPAFSTNRGVHCISMYTAWQLVTFPTCHVCNRGRLPGFDRETSRTVSRRAVHSATATGSRNINVTYLSHRKFRWLQWDRRICVHHGSSSPSRTDRRYDTGYQSHTLIKNLIFLLQIKCSTENW